MPFEATVMIMSAAVVINNIVIIIIINNIIVVIILLRKALAYNAFQYVQDFVGWVMHIVVRTVS